MIRFLSRIAEHFEAHRPPLLIHKDKKPFFYDRMRDFREAEAIASYRHPPRNVFAGDSIFHFGEVILEEMTGAKSVAIGGDRVQWLRDRLNVNVYQYRPPKILFSIGGNDLLAGREPIAVMRDIEALFTAMTGYRATCKSVHQPVAIGLLEILPLGPAHWRTHQRTEILNAIVRPVCVRYEVQFVRCRKALAGQRTMQGSDDCFIREDFSMPDEVHINAKAYREVLGPILKEFFA